VKDGSGGGRPRLEGAERAFVERLRTGYAPPPLDGTRRAAFSARLQERLESRRRGRAGLPIALASALAAAGAALWLASGPDGVPGSTAPAATRSGVGLRSPAPGTPSRQGEAILALTLGSEAGDPEDAETALPPEYTAIEDVLLGS